MGENKSLRDVLIAEASQSSRTSEMIEKISVDIEELKIFQHTIFKKLESLESLMIKGKASDCQKTQTQGLEKSPDNNYTFSRYGPRTKDGRLICFICQKAGHISRHCFSLPKYREWARKERDKASQ